MMRGSFLVGVALAAVAASHTRGAEPTSVHVLGNLLMPEEAEPESTTTMALRAEISRLKTKLDECEANCAPSPNKPAQHRRALSATPAPTPLTPIPSIEPSVSSAPTLVEWFKLAAAVADATNEEVFVQADVMFPSQSPITIDSDRSVSIVGRPAEDGGRASLDGLSDSRFFVVDGGTLHLSHLNLVNGSVPEPYYGGAILVLEDGQLVVSSCDIRGPGRHDLRGAPGGAGVHVNALRTTVSFSNTTFEGLNAFYGAAVNIYKPSGDGITSAFTFRHCQFLRNFAVRGILHVSNYAISADLYDCQFLHNEGMSVVLDLNTNSVGKIRSCTFRDNAMPHDDDLFPGAALSLASGGMFDVWDCVFVNDNNAGSIGEGGALCVSGNARAIVINSTFVENTAYNGGALHVMPGCSLTVIGCYACANSASGFYGGFARVEGGTFVMLNSTVTESYAFLGGVAHVIDSSIVNIENSVFTNSRASYSAGFYVFGSSVSMTDCIHRGSELAGPFLAYKSFYDGSSVNALRCIFQEHRTPNIGGALYMRASTGYFEDCDFIDNVVSAGNGGTFFLRAGGDLTVFSSRVVGSAAPGKGSVAHLDAGSSMRIVGSTITNCSGEAAFAINNDEVDVDFNTQLDSVVVDGTVNIFSNGSDVLLQNCDGFGSASVKKADIATCASTSEFCVPSSCFDATVAGTDCICTVDGVEVPFPTDCMQSAIIEVRRLPPIESTLIPCACVWRLLPPL